MLLLVLYFALIDMTVIHAIRPANTCKDFMRLYEYAGWSESSLDLSGVCGTHVLPKVDNA